MSKKYDTRVVKTGGPLMSGETQLMFRGGNKTSNKKYDTNKPVNRIIVESSPLMFKNPNRIIVEPHPFAFTTESYIRNTPIKNLPLNQLPIFRKGSKKIKDHRYFQNSSTKFLFKDKNFSKRRLMY